MRDSCNCTKVGCKSQILVSLRVFWIDYSTCSPQGIFHSCTEVSFLFQVVSVRGEKKLERCPNWSSLGI